MNSSYWQSHPSWICPIPFERYLGLHFCNGLSSATHTRAVHCVAKHIFSCVLNLPSLSFCRHERCLSLNWSMSLIDQGSTDADNAGSRFLWWFHAHGNTSEGSGQVLSQNNPAKVQRLTFKDLHGVKAMKSAMSSFGQQGKCYLDLRLHTYSLCEAHCQMRAYCKLQHTNCPVH